MAYKLQYLMIYKSVFHLSLNGKKLMFIGNGASASMSSHYTPDFWKNGKIRAINFNDHASLTAIATILIMKGI